jgi:small subunit ribosomal protein S20
MAHHKSAQKRIRQTERRTEVNRARVSRIRTVIKEFEAAVAAGKKAEAQEIFKVAEPAIMSGVNKGVLKQATASRKVSRLSAKLKAIARVS